MSKIYESGSKGLALNNIKAAIKERILDQEDGSQAFDSVSFLAWIQEQGNQMIADGEYTQYPSGTRADGSLIMDSAAREVLANASSTLAPALVKLTNIVRKEYWHNRAGWPSSTTQTSGDIIAALKVRFAELKTLSEALSKKHAALVNPSTLPDLVADFMEIEGVKYNLPDPVTRIIDSRFYITTFVTDRNEESAPSRVSTLLEVDQNDSVSVAVPVPPAGRFLSRWRLYRSNSGSASAAFQFVDEVSINSAFYVDSKKASELQEPCPTLTWAEPPVDLKGLVGMPNGIMAGFTGNVVAFCEPYYPYAWPVEYQVTTESPIVAIAAFGQTLVVGTLGVPYFISGADSASMSSQKMDSNQSCVSARSMVSVDGGVVYASPDGLCLADGSGIRVITAEGGFFPGQALFARVDWQRLKPESIIAAYHERTVFWLWDNGAQRGAYALNLGSGKLVTLDLQASALYVDKSTDTLYAANGGLIYAIFGGAEPRTGLWRGKVAEHAKQAGYAWLSVASDFEHPVVVRWFGDGVLRYTATVMTRDPVRLPAGRWLEHEIEIESKARWTTVTFASSTAELQAV